MLAVCLFVTAPIGHAQERESEHVLVLTAHSAGDVFFDAVIDGIRGRLIGRLHLSLSVEALDLHDHGGEQHLAALESALAAKQNSNGPDVVIAIGDDALNFAMRVRNPLLNNAPIVFAEIAAISAADAEALSDATGFLAGHDTAKTIRIAESLQPGLERIVVVDDGDFRADWLRADLRDIAAAHEDRLRIEHLPRMSIQEYGDIVSALGPRDAVFLLHLRRDKTGRPYSQRAAVARLSRQSTAPVYAAYGPLAGFGIVGGRLVSFLNLGDELGGLAAEILDGRSVNDIPVRREPPHVTVFDYRQLVRFGLDGADLPDGAVVISEPDTFYYRYRRFLWIGATVLAALLGYIALLLAAIQRRARVQTGLERVIDAVRRPVPELALADGPRATEAAARDALERLASVAPRLVPVAAWRRGSGGRLSRAAPVGTGSPDPLLAEAADSGSRFEGHRALIRLPGAAAPAAVAELESRARLDAVDRRLLDICASALAAEHAGLRAAGLAASLQAAAEIQAAMLPRDFTALGAPAGLALHAHLGPARQVGGDFYDAFSLADGRLCLVIGDVSDKGAPSALMMATTLTAIRAAAERAGEASGAPGEILGHANAVLCRDNPKGMFATVFLAVWDVQAATLTYSNAGHNPPRVRRAGGWSTHPVAANIALGVLPGIAFEEGALNIDPGDALLLYTDGVTDAIDTTGRAFRESGLDGVLAGLPADASPRDIVEACETGVTGFADGAPQADDITLLAVERL